MDYLLNFTDRWRIYIRKKAREDGNVGQEEEKVGNTPVNRKGLDIWQGCNCEILMGEYIT